MEVSKRLGQIAFFDVETDLSPLSQNERLALAHCVRAADWISAIYLRQVVPNLPEILEKLNRCGAAERAELLRYLEINGGPWDRFHEMESFVKGIGPKPAGASFYPPNITNEKWDNWLEAHPEDRAQFESKVSVVRANADRLMSLPYSEVYREFLEEAAKELRTGARFLPSGPLRKFLELRSEAFLSNDYWDSELAWLETVGHPFEVTIGPYEVYEDRFLGLKATFEAFVGISDKQSSAALLHLSGAFGDFDAILGEQMGYSPSGVVAPIEVVMDVYRGGEAAFGSQFVAYNLPNDRRIHKLKGSKNVLSRTMMAAKFTKLGRLIAERLLHPQDIELYAFDKRMLFVLVHELAHGLGPGVSKVGEQQSEVQVALRDLYTPMEELKANTLGAAMLAYLQEQRRISTDDIAGCLITELVGFVQDIRSSFTQAHSVASLIQYNWLRANGSLRFNSSHSILSIDTEQALSQLRVLSRECLGIQLAGNYDRAKSFIENWGGASAEVHRIVSELADLPLEVFPVFRSPNSTSDILRLWSPSECTTI